MVMNILRAEHSAEYPYVMMSKATANNGKLSLAARGLLAWLLDKPDTWDIDPEATARLNSTTLHEIKKLLKELAQHSYLIPPKRQHVKGRWQYTPYTLRETPNLATEVEIQSPENSDTETDALLQDDCNSMTVFDNLSRTGGKHKTAAVQITKINNNSNHSEQETTKTDNPPVANPELPDPEPVVLSVSEIPEQSPIIGLDIRALILPDTPLLPANVSEPPAGIFVLEEFPSKHEPAAQLQPPEVEYFHNDMLENIDREIPGLKPGDKPLYKPDPTGALVMETFETITGGTISPTINGLLNDGIKLRGAPAVIALIEKSVKADSRAGFVINSLKNWQNEKQPERRPPKEKPADGIPWNDDGSLGSWQ